MNLESDSRQRGDDGHLRYLLTAYIFGDISSAGRIEVERHLEQCEECRTEYELLRETVDLVSSSSREAEEPEYSFDELRVARVLEASRRRSRFLGRYSLPLGVAAAASLLIVLSVPFLQSQRSGRPSFESARVDRAADSPRPPEAPMRRSRSSASSALNHASRDHRAIESKAEREMKRRTMGREIAPEPPESVLDPDDGDSIAEAPVLEVQPPMGERSEEDEEAGGDHWGFDMGYGDGIDVKPAMKLRPEILDEVKKNQIFLLTTEGVTLTAPQDTAFNWDGHSNSVGTIVGGAVGEVNTNGLLFDGKQVERSPSQQPGTMPQPESMGTPAESRKLASGLPVLPGKAAESQTGQIGFDLGRQTERRSFANPGQAEDSDRSVARFGKRRGRALIAQDKIVEAPLARKTLGETSTGSRVGLGVGAVRLEPQSEQDRSLLDVKRKFNEMTKEVDSSSAEPSLELAAREPSDRRRRESGRNRVQAREGVESRDFLGGGVDAEGLLIVDGKLNDLYGRSVDAFGVSESGGEILGAGRKSRKTNDSQSFSMGGLGSGLEKGIPERLLELAEKTRFEQSLRLKQYLEYKGNAVDRVDGLVQRVAEVNEPDSDEESRISRVLIPEPEIGDEGLGREGFRARYGVNPFVDTRLDHFSTFAMDVDIASYNRARDLLNSGRLPDPSSIRVEAFVNSPEEEFPADPSCDFSVFCEGAPSLFGVDVDLVKLSVKARELEDGERLPAVLTLAIDTSGSMFLEERLEMIRESLSLLINALDPSDRVAVVAYGSEAYLALPQTPARERERILSVIGSLEPHGDTNVEAGLDLAYRVADDAFATRAMNRVVLLSDGVATAGARAAEELIERVQLFAGRGIYLSVIGFGRERYNDAFLEGLAQGGNGNYAYVDDVDAAYELFVRDLPSTLQVLARDAKIQVDFDPSVVSHYRLLGYVNRDIADNDFRNDSVDAGEVGPGSTVTALYEIRRHPGSHGSLGRVSVRYHATSTGRVEELGFPLRVGVIATSLAEVSDSYVFSACLAEFAELLMESYWSRTGSFGRVAQAMASIGPEFRLHPQYSEFTRMVETARRLTIEELSSK